MAYIGSLQLDGVNDYVDLGSTSVVPNLTGALSITVFIRSTTTGAIQSIIGNLRDSTTVGWQFKLSSNHRPEFQFYTPSGGKRAWGDIPGMELADSTCTFVGVTFDGNTVKFYINGTEYVRETLVNTVTISENTVQNVRVGHRQAAGGGFEFFAGSMDDLRVYNRTLSSAEMLSLYYQGSISSTGLLGYYPFNEASGTVANDFGSNSLPGTLINGATWAESCLLVATDEFVPTLKNPNRDTGIVQAKTTPNGFTDDGSPDVLVDDIAYLVDDTVALSGGQKVASAPIFIK